MATVLVLTGIFAVPTFLLVIGFRLSGWKVDWLPLIWAGVVFLVYVGLLKSRNVIPVPLFLEELPLIWFGKILSLSGTIVLLYFLPRVDFRAAGVIWTQNKGSLRPVIITGTITLIAATGTSFAFMYSPNTTLENILFQASLPGIDEELFMRGLLLLLLHQAFGKGLLIWGAQTGWGLWLVVAIFGLLPGVTTDNGELVVKFAALASTGFTGFVLTWMRERTGSLLAPILFHNIFNVALAFV